VGCELVDAVFQPFLAAAPRRVLDRLRMAVQRALCGTVGQPIWRQRRRLKEKRAESALA
jgi:hypothetical protein